MRYKITLIPLEPYLFGGDNTYGKIGDKENGTYITNSRYFPQQSAILGMLKKEIMTQSGALTRKIRGEWVKTQKKEEAKKLAGVDKFNIFESTPQKFGSIKNISPIFLQKDGKDIFKVANIKKFQPKKIGDNYLLKNFTAKDDMFDNYEDKDGKQFKSVDIFKEVSQTLNQKEASESSLYKKTSYKLEKGFSFGFYLECDFALKSGIVTLGADRSSFQMEVKLSNESLEFKSDYLLLLSDAYITVPLKAKESCEFAITSEISYAGIQNDFKGNQKQFKKSDKVYLYEKGSVIIGAEQRLLDNLNNKNLQQIGYNIYTKGETK